MSRSGKRNRERVPKGEPSRVVLVVRGRPAVEVVTNDRGVCRARVLGRKRQYTRVDREALAGGLLPHFPDLTHDQRWSMLWA